jgi:hypothetical protein
MSTGPRAYDQQNFFRPVNFSVFIYNYVLLEDVTNIFFALKSAKILSDQRL